jgi:hypothetical protein
MNNLINKVVSILFWVAVGWILAALNPKAVYKTTKKIDELAYHGRKTVKAVKDTLKNKKPVKEDNKAPVKIANVPANVPQAVAPKA